MSRNNNKKSQNLLIYSVCFRCIRCIYLPSFIEVGLHKVGEIHGTVFTPEFATLKGRIFCPNLNGTLKYGGTKKTIIEIIRRSNRVLNTKENTDELRICSFCEVGEMTFTSNCSSKRNVGWFEKPNICHSNPKNSSNYYYY